MSAVLSNASGPAHSLNSKLNWRLLSFLLVCYLFANMDRFNIGLAKLQMQSDLGLSAAAYGLGAGIFFIGYVLFEIPSNLMFPKWGARKTFFRILVLWGLTSSGMMFVRGETSFYALRFLLGAFEAGFAPGMIFYLTYWYGRENMGRVMGIVMLAGPISGVIVGPVSGWIMTHMAGIHGLAGWQWMFLLEGLPCVFLGVLTLFVVSDKPADARWLSAEEKAIISARSQPASTKHNSFGQIAKDPYIYLMAVVLFCFICMFYALAFWLPTIIKASGVSDPETIGLYSAIPSVGGFIAMLLAGRFSDRFSDRRWHVAIPALLAAVALGGATVFTGQLIPSLALITVAAALIFASYTVFWAMPSEYLHGDSAAGGIAVINTVALLGGFLSPTIIGLATKLTGNTKAGMAAIVVLVFVGGCLAMFLRHNAPRHAR